jgi:hypothetical protein
MTANRLENDQNPTHTNLRPTPGSRDQQPHDADAPLQEHDAFHSGVHCDGRINEVDMNDLESSGRWVGRSDWPGFSGVGAPSGIPEAGVAITARLEPLRRRAAAASISATNVRSSSSTMTAMFATICCQFAVCADRILRGRAPRGHRAASAWR